MMLTSNLWTAVGLHDGVKGKVVDFVYKTSEGPPHPSKQLPEAIVVEFSHLDDSFPSFLPDVPKTVAIPAIKAEWNNPNGETFIREQFPIMLSWVFTIHKSRGKTLERAVIDFGKATKCSGMTLVALSRVHELRHMMLKPISFERLEKINNSSGLAVPQAATERLLQKQMTCQLTVKHILFCYISVSNL